MVYHWAKNIQFWLFPAVCLLCGAPGTHRRDLCSGCDGDLPRNLKACRRCAQPLTSGGSLICGQCQRHPPVFDSMTAPFCYDPPIDGLIRDLKFRGHLPAGQLLGELLGDDLEQRRLPLPQGIVPVPLHLSRLRQRGFNQSLELARPLAKRFGLPILAGSVHRLRPTPPQSQLDLRQRLTNVRGAFAARRSIEARHLAIVDDVVTTGSTVTELAQVLRQAGVERIDVWACARTEQ